MAHTRKNSQLIETIPKKIKLFCLLDNKLFKSTILNLLKELKEIMYKEWKEIIGIISHQRQNISRDRNYISKVVGKVDGSQTEILRLKSTVTETKIHRRG